MNEAKLSPKNYLQKDSKLQLFKSYRNKRQWNSEY